MLSFTEKIGGENSKTFYLSHRNYFIYLLECF